MADIELIVKISEESYNNLKMGCTQRVSDGEMIEALKNGIPLPKGHGRLGDLDILLNKAMKHLKSYADAKLEDSSYCRGKLHAYELYVEEVNNAPTIIEADKAESEGK